MYPLVSRALGRCCGALLVAVAAALVLLASEPMNAAASHGCTARGKTLLRTQEARIFFRRTNPRNVDSDFNYYGCSKRKGSTYRLNLEDEYGNLAERFRLSGRYAATVQSFGSGAGSDTDRLIVTDLITGGRLYFGPREGSSFEALEGGGVITALVLKRNGSGAFSLPSSVASRGPTGSLVLTPTVRLYTVTAAGERLAAQSPAIRAGSLRLSRDRRSLTYLEGGRRKSVPFE